MKNRIQKLEELASAVPELLVLVRVHVPHDSWGRVGPIKNWEIINRVVNAMDDLKESEDGS